MFLEENYEVETIPGIEEHLLALKDEFDRYFPEWDTTEFSLFRSPFEANADVLSDDVTQLELVKLEADSAAVHAFKTKRL